MCPGTVNRYAMYRGSRRGIYLMDYYARMEKRYLAAGGPTDPGWKESLCDPRISLRGRRRCCVRTTWADGPVPPRRSIRTSGAGTRPSSRSGWRTWTSVGPQGRYGPCSRTSGTRQGAPHSLQPRAPHRRATSPTRSTGRAPPRSRTRPRVRRTSGLCQPPVHAIAVRRIWQTSPGARTKAVAGPAPSSARSTRKLLAWHRYLATDRDPEGSGLVTIYHPWESGTDNSPRWDAALERIDVGEMPSYERATTSSTSAIPRTVRPAASTTAFCGSGASQAGPLRRGRHLRATPVSGQGRPVLSASWLRPTRRCWRSPRSSRPRRRTGRL